MHNIYIRDLIEKCECKLLLGDLDTELDNFSKDTRTLKKGDIYIGIKGEHFEGSTLYKEAFEKGAKGCIINNSVSVDEEVINEYKDRFIVSCDDTIKCIQSLASYKRSLYDIPVIGVTGSVGKTSTKDIIYSVLSKKYKTLKTEGNYNNHIGVPLTLLRLKDHEALVVEMGMNNLGEISLLSKISKPMISVITNVGTAHIGILGSRENILKAKLEILDGMEKDGILVINNDNDLLHEWYKDNKDSYKIVTFGIENKSNFMAEHIEVDKYCSKYDVLIDGKKHEFKINVPGLHFVSNALCALAIGNIFNISIEDIKDGIENFVLTKRRMEIETIKGMTIINDSYNANLDSMNSAINYLGSLKGRKIAILGDMLELGDYSESLHRLVGKCVFSNKIDYVITVGNYSKFINEELNKLGFNEDNMFHFNDNDSAINKIKSMLKKDDNVLIKSSFGMNFIEIYNSLKDSLK